MKYFKSSQPIPGKGFAYTYYECDESLSVRRYVTFIPATAETKRVPNPAVKTLYQPETLMEATEEEFRRHWPAGVDEDNGQDGETAASTSGAPREARAWKYFHPDMTVEEAMSIHPRVSEVFAAFNLGGCGHCAIGGYETVAQVCAAYGVDLDTLMEVLEDLVAASEKHAQAQASS